MKSRKLTADEISIKLSLNDIAAIPPNGTGILPADKTASGAVNTGLRIRGKGRNLFVCGASAIEREMLTIPAAEAAAVYDPDAENKARDLILRANPDSEKEPLLISLPPGGSKEYENEGFDFRILVSNSSGSRPVVFERNPLPERLFGRNSTKIKSVEAGSVLKAGGGFLFLNAEELIEEEKSWKLLKRILRSGKTVIGYAETGLEHGARGLSLPEIDIDLKVIILGTEQNYDHLYNSDEDFGELFQFFAEFDSVIDLDPENLALTVNHFRHYSRSLGMTLSDSGALEAVKYSIAESENLTKLSTILSDIDTILDEAALIAAETEKSSVISEEAVRNAVHMQSDRYKLLERKILEDIKSGEINLKVEGSETGKVNGLAIIEKGPYSFGFPGLISARIAPGENGLVNIEHEAGLSEEIHDKWVLILEGFLRSRFARDFPISIFASLCFEQSYSAIEGDSASSSELYALLSAISDIPVRQDIAVTGSLSQTGEIQAVGGLREKIEGFYNTCRAINYTGSQGVIVPYKNINNIVLPDEIITEIREDRFHIYPVTTVNDSMEILTGIEAGSRNSRGIFPHGSLNYQVEKNLKKLAQQSKGFGN